MPIDHDARVAITLRLRTAYAETQGNYARKPAGIEIIRDVALAQQWLTIGAAYSGIEQTLKYLIAFHKDLTVDELLVENGIVENPAEEPEKRTRYRIHELGTLFLRLDRQTREAVEHDYAVWQSLYDYLPIFTCAGFLDHTQGDDNRGHLDWRYCPIQGRLPPTNSADAMLAIWASLIRRCEEHAGIPHLTGGRTADDAVRLGLCECLERACVDCEQRAAENDEPIPPLREELKRWAPSGACLVNNMAALLSHQESYLEIPEREGSEPMRRTLADCLRQLSREAGEGMRGALPTFARRALGYFPTGESVRLNPDAMRFENVPWPLQSKTRDNAPEGATRVAPEETANGRLRDIWHYARVADYQVKETREFAVNLDRPVQWHLRMRVSDQHEGAETARISVWQEQRPGNLDQLCMVRFCWLESAILRFICSDSGINQGVGGVAWPSFRRCGHTDPAVGWSSGNAAPKLDQAPEVEGEVGHPDLGARPGQADRPDHQSHRLLLHREHVLDRSPLA